MDNRELFFHSIIKISEALSNNSELFKDLDQIFKSDKLRFYEIARKHELYNDPLITKGTLDREIKVKKVLGIILSAEGDEKLRYSIIKIIKKYYPVKINEKTIRNAYKSYCKNSLSNCIDRMSDDYATSFL